MAETCHTFYLITRSLQFPDCGWKELLVWGGQGGKHTLGWFWIGAEGIERGWSYWTSYSNRSVWAQGELWSLKHSLFTHVLAGFPSEPTNWSRYPKEKSHICQRSSVFPQDKDTLGPFKKTARFILHGFPQPTSQE